MGPSSTVGSWWAWAQGTLAVRIPWPGRPFRPYGRRKPTPLAALGMRRRPSGWGTSSEASPSPDHLQHRKDLPAWRVLRRPAGYSASLGHRHLGPGFASAGPQAPWLCRPRCPDGGGWRPAPPRRSVCCGTGGFQSNLRGLYPCGEGAGYAGGIVSARWMVSGWRRRWPIPQKHKKQIPPAMVPRDLFRIPRIEVG